MKQKPANMLEPGASYYLPGAEPFFFPGGDTGCLCVHGLASSPGEMRWLGAALARSGYTVLGVRLDGHGADYRSLRRLTWADWYGSLLDGYHLLRGQCRRVFIVGHSTGGTLALLAATQVAVHGLAILAAPVLFRSRLITIAHLLRYVLPFTDQTDTSGLVELVQQEQHRRGEPLLGRIRYDIWASNAGAQLYALAQHTRQHLHEITVPLLALYARQDPTVRLESIQIITQGVRSAVIEPHILQGSGHNIPIDSERETAFTLVSDFVRRYSLEAAHESDTQSGH